MIVLIVDYFGYFHTQHDTDWGSVAPFSKASGHEYYNTLCLTKQ